MIASLFTALVYEIHSPKRPTAYLCNVHRNSKKTILSAIRPFLILVWLVAISQANFNIFFFLFYVKSTSLKKEWRKPKKSYLQSDFVYFGDCFKINHSREACFFCTGDLHVLIFCLNSIHVFLIAFENGNLLSFDWTSKKKKFNWTQNNNFYVHVSQFKFIFLFFLFQKYMYLC